MEYLLVKFNDNYCDEFDVDGFNIMSEQEFKDYLEEWKKEIEKNGFDEFYFGTNECLTYEGVDEFEKRFTTEPLTEEEALVLKKFFKSSYGVFPELF